MHGKYSLGEPPGDADDDSPEPARATDATVDRHRRADIWLGVSQMTGMGRLGRTGSSSPRIAAWPPAIHTICLLTVTLREAEPPLLANRGSGDVSYTSLRRFIAGHGWRRRKSATVRMEESPAGEVAEMDFGLLGLVPNPESGVRNKVWALIVVLRYSRHCFV